MLEMIVIFAHWCPICNMMRPIVEEFEVDYAGKLKITWLDSEMCPDAMETYGVQIVPTFILQKQGQEIGRMSGMVGEYIFRERIEASIF